MNRRTMMAATGSAVVLMFGLVACGDEDDDASGDGGGGASVTTTLTEDDETSGEGGGGGSVSVVLTDGALVLDPASADAGGVEIVATNAGGDLHDLVIVKGDDPAALPVNEDGAVIEDDLPEGDLIGEIAVVDPGTEETVSFDLDAGSYIVFCNIYEPSAVAPLPKSHFEDGMVDFLTVT
ncbi:MAG: hypothetical protein ACR2QE_12095 [Acidimicrobiales bacterium]